ncbi:hypothetical protein DFH07DRAFT_776006 [Mycena maculata]|uniref:Uncharacterized protein n=1 Tax=Mycena maculata TaxID=230809 RepID=A0AAD7IQX4_9AGAR|nr:hypothetical protein DFH07DRAFT_776006 [Mycena maculata]
MSPGEFERLMQHLMARFVCARAYLEELYSQRDHWAYAWVGNIFTAGVRTSGRAESENSVNKVIGGLNISLYQLYLSLKECSNVQEVHSQIWAQDSSKCQHDTELEALFREILGLLRKFVGPYALNKCYAQMAKSLFYNVSLLQLPDGTRDWDKVGYVGDGMTPGTGLFNSFENDTAYMSTQWLLRQMADRGLVPTYLVRVTHKTLGTVHIAALFPDGRYARKIQFTAQALPHASILNPLRVANLPEDVSPATQTIPVREVYHSIQAEIRLLMNGIQTREQLDQLQAALVQIRHDGGEETRLEEIHDPPILLGKGRPRTERLTGATEGRPRGGGAGIRAVQRPQYQAPTLSTAAKTVSKRQNQCTIPGHNRMSCQ